MENHDIVSSMIYATAALTVAIRYLPMVLLRDVTLPPRVERFLCSLPIGILAALVAQSVFLSRGSLDLSWSNHYLQGLAATVILATVTRSLVIVVFGGMAVVGLLAYAR